MYLRVKRRNQTFFVLTEPHESFLKIKETLAGVIGISGPGQVQLWHTNKQKELLDVGTVSDQELENDAIVYMCLKKENSDQWEEIQVTKIEMEHNNNRPSVE
ncbi:hypothetical protein THRCLA_22140 [Thraustotheca clavata]|uniref:Ubiquitin-like domain-containing protein n=1 Tax=Thraustotheca clavata TaxID=74557 RepID=A0A1V9ZBR3_9STRA|nr:hypothetical protein THRCLA_22140 [Thraustotheca clavata]